MENKDYLERTYKTNFDCALKYCQQKNWGEANRSLEKAGDALLKLVPLTYGAEQERLIAKAKSLRELLQDVRSRAEAPQMTVKTNHITPSQDKKGGNAEQSEDGINYVINGIDVKGFLTEESNDVVTFNDVKGMEKEKALIKREFFLTEEQRAFNEYLGKKPKTFILLYGVPGTGKTFFAKAISEELKNYSGGDIPFFSVVGSQLSDSKVGATEKNIQAVFEFCKQFEKCVLFIDEFDTLAPDRKQNTGDPTAASRVTVLLQMMDGFASAKGTLVIAATNCPYNLDGAVLSRANTRIEIPLPSYEVIYSVLNAKIGNNLAPDVDMSRLAARFEDGGYSNRDIKNFIENIKDQLIDEFNSVQLKGESRGFEEFRYTNAMLDRAFKEQPPTTKQSDVIRIEQFKNSGE